MIKSLYIKNFILIDELKLDFDKGFNVFTGETGAGKSIIINAIDVVLGSRTNKEDIKTGEERALIELNIEVTGDFNKNIFENNGIAIENNELIISREISETTTRSRINGVLVTQDFIKEIREFLLDIHTQHQNYNYIQPKYHIKLLDNFGDYEYKNNLTTYNELYSKYNNLLKQLEIAKNNTQSTQQQIDFLKFQIGEIESVQIDDIEEDVKLENELELLLNAEKLKELSYSSYWSLYGEDANIVGSLGTIKNNISKLSQLDSSTEEIEKDIIDCQEILKDIASRLRNYAEKQEIDNEKIDVIQLRLDSLNKIKRKYGNTLENVLSNYEKLTSEINSIEFSQDEVVRLESEINTLRTELYNLAENVSTKRKIMGESLSNLITQELEKLELPKVQFAIDIQSCNLCENGIDNVEFLISTNISEPLKPLIKVASGGEISRVMLAIKTIFANADKTNTVIFDEIDTGISGKASQAVADAIVNLAKYHQIILITHQPIIAAKSNTHFYVAKDQEESTKIKVYNLQGENKVKAIALLSSGEINEESMNFARGLINQNYVASKTLV